MEKPLVVIAHNQRLSFISGQKGLGFYPILAKCTTGMKVKTNFKSTADRVGSTLHGCSERAMDLLVRQSKSRFSAGSRHSLPG